VFGRRQRALVSTHHERKSAVLCTHHSCAKITIKNDGDNNALYAPDLKNLLPYFRRSAGLYVEIRAQILLYLVSTIILENLLAIDDMYPVSDGNSDDAWLLAEDQYFAIRT